MEFFTCASWRWRHYNLSKRLQVVAQPHVSLTNSSILERLNATRKEAVIRMAISQFNPATFITNFLIIFARHHLWYQRSLRTLQDHPLSAILAAMIVIGSTASAPAASSVPPSATNANFVLQLILDILVVVKHGTSLRHRKPYLYTQTWQREKEREMWLRVNRLTALRLHWRQNMH